MTRVLIVDDERKMRRVLQILLEQMGLESVPADDGNAALLVLEEQRVDLVLTDLRMPGMNGIDLLARVRALEPEVPVIVLTAYGTVPTAVAAMKQGAFDYILKPFDLEAIELIIRKALEMRQYRAEHRYHREESATAPVFERSIGVSPAIRHVYELVRRIAPTKSSVLITGETGSGKELIARAIHSLSPRCDKLFVPINCAAIPSDLLESELFGHVRGAFTGAQNDRTGKFEYADGGTLFLDEIGDMAYPLQAKLLRVLEEGIVERVGANKRLNVDARVVSSTNRDLPAAMRQGLFREDLYYRLNVFHLHVPPLRERREDIPHLGNLFLERFTRELGKPRSCLTGDACALLARYHWPGNVRELQNLMERAAVLGDGSEIDASFFRLLLPQLPEDTTPQPPESLELELALDNAERKVILRALAAAGNNKAHAARLLGISERTLWYKLKRHGL